MFLFGGHFLEKCIICLHTQKKLTDKVDIYPHPPTNVGQCPETGYVESKVMVNNQEYVHMDVCKNRGTPKWMISNGKPY